MCGREVGRGCCVRYERTDTDSYKIDDSARNRAGAGRVRRYRGRSVTCVVVCRRETAPVRGVRWDVADADHWSI